MKRSLFRTLQPHGFRGLVLAGAAAAWMMTSVTAASGSAIEPSLAQATAPTAANFVNGDFTCTFEHLAVVTERQQRISDAPTVEEARDLALTPTRTARRALQLASLVVPSSEKLAQARERLDGFEVRVQQSATPAAVAGEFGRLLDADLRSGNLVQLADLEVGHANVHHPAGCHYSTGEIVAIVIGFILAIIPGVILLFVLC